MVGDKEEVVWTGIEGKLQEIMIVWRRSIQPTLNPMQGQKTSRRDWCHQPGQSMSMGNLSLTWRADGRNSASSSGWWGYH